MQKEGKPTVSASAPKRADSRHPGIPVWEELFPLKKEKAKRAGLFPSTQNPVLRNESSYLK